MPCAWSSFPASARRSPRCRSSSGATSRGTGRIANPAARPWPGHGSCPRARSSARAPGTRPRRGSSRRSRRTTTPPGELVSQRGARRCASRPGRTSPLVVDSGPAFTPRRGAAVTGLSRILPEARGAHARHRPRRALPRRAPARPAARAAERALVLRRRGGNRARPRQPHARARAHRGRRAPRRRRGHFRRLRHRYRPARRGVASLPQRAGPRLRHALRAAGRPNRQVGYADFFLPPQTVGCPVLGTFATRDSVGVLAREQRRTRASTRGAARSRRYRQLIFRESE